MLAKVASDLNKPNGQCLVPFDACKVRAFVGALYVRKLPGIGRISEAQLTGLGLRLVADVRREMARLRCLLSPRMAEWLHRASLGISETRRGGGAAQYRRKSISLERTFRDQASLAELSKTTTALCVKLACQMQGVPAAFALSHDLTVPGPDKNSPPQSASSSSSSSSADQAAEADGLPQEARSSRRRRAGAPSFSHTPGFFGTAESDSEDEETGEKKQHPVMRGKTLTLKLKLATFEVRQRSCTMDSVTNNPDVIASQARRLLRQELEDYESSSDGKRFALRLIGIKMHNLVFDADEKTRQTRGIDVLLKRQRGVPEPPPQIPDASRAHAPAVSLAMPPPSKRRAASQQARAGGALLEAVAAAASIAASQSGAAKTSSASQSGAARGSSASRPVERAIRIDGDRDKGLSGPSVLQRVLQRRMTQLRTSSRPARSVPKGGTMDSFVSRN
jgi:nucleotidyltransferase/DNA polymerase involved in DNA repair